MTRSIAIFGSTGRTGQALVETALQRDWQVRALCRPGRRPETTHPGLIVVEGELTDDRALALTIAGSDAVCCVFGPRPPFTQVFCAAATSAIIAALREARTARLVCQTGAMIGPYPRNRSVPFELMARAYARRAPAAALDRQHQEAAVRDSGLEWTLIKPPRLTDGPPGARVQAGPEVKVGLLSRIRRADLSRFVLDEITHPRFVQQIVFVKA